jgi:hypothetical protein
LVTGYLHSDYAKSLAKFGIPHQLPRSGGWILVRKVQGFSYQDAMGIYPLFVCSDWSQLNLDLQEIGDELGLVSLAVVADPFGHFGSGCLQACFKDVAAPFKEHYVIDLESLAVNFVCKHHRRYARKALQHLYVERCDKPEQHINVWGELYANLINIHNISGISAFSRTAFAKQLSVPGIVMFRAVSEERTVGMLLWYVQEEVGYYHLGAYSPVGYDLRASFALFWFAIEHFAANGLKWLNLGGGAGAMGDGTDGLSRFKSGWSTGVRTAYFCGRVFDHTRYSEIVRVKGISATDYFPAYRKGELG